MPADRLTLRTIAEFDQEWAACAQAVRSSDPIALAIVIKDLHRRDAQAAAWAWDGSTAAFVCRLARLALMEATMRAREDRL